MFSYYLAFIWGNHNPEIQTKVYLRFSIDHLDYPYTAGTRGNLKWGDFKTGLQMKEAGGKRRRNLNKT
jgi:hypothetical protein